MQRPSEPRKDTWLGTYTGGTFDPLNPRAEDVHIVDIAHHLAGQNRYNGATRRWYNVAEHSFIVSMHVPEPFRQEALLHDAAEAYIGDMCSGLKHHPYMAFYRFVEEQITDVIFERFGIVPTEESSLAIHKVDKRLVIDEVTQLMNGAQKYLDKRKHMKPVGSIIIGLPGERAKDIFLARFEQLFPEWWRRYEY